ncbi:MAG: hypothetical protein K5906_03075 [Bacilli bacterium]|nr:hypothetical protein [Bacilli bacterium]
MKKSIKYVGHYVLLSSIYLIVNGIHQMKFIYDARKAEKANNIVINE